MNISRVKKFEKGDKISFEKVEKRNVLGVYAEQIMISCTKS